MRTTQQKVMIAFISAFLGGLWMYVAFNLKVIPWVAYVTWIVFLAALGSPAWSNKFLLARKFSATYLLGMLGVSGAVIYSKAAAPQIGEGLAHATSVFLFMFAMINLAMVKG